MTQQWIFIEPSDVWMFRDSKPFTASESFFARSMFPPQPGTIQGAIRTYHYERTRQIIGSARDMGDLRITGPFVAQLAPSGKHLIPFFPAPLDILPGNPSTRLAPAANCEFLTDVASFGEEWRPLVPIGALSGDRPDEGEFWLSQPNFDKYLRQTSELFALNTDGDLYGYEDRTGLALDYDRRAGQESLFYRAEFVRPQEGIGLLVGIERPEPIFYEAQGQISIGGESRTGNFSVIDFQMPKYSASEGRIKVILLTSAYFTDGWQPMVGNWSRWMGQEAKLVSVALGRPRAFSGWDMVEKRPKPLRHFVPAGSVFYFKDATAPSIPFTESPRNEADFGAMGYGGFATTSWDYV